MRNTTTDPDVVQHDDIPARPRDILDEVFKGDGAEQWWNTRNQMFGGIRPRDVYRAGYSGEVRVMTVLNMLADGNF